MYNNLFINNNNIQIYFEHITVTIIWIRMYLWLLITNISLYHLKWHVYCEMKYEPDMFWWYSRYSFIYKTAREAINKPNEDDIYNDENPPNP